GRAARSVRARAHRGTARGRQPRGGRSRQPARCALSRRQPGHSADRLSAVGHQPGGATFARHGRRHAGLHRSRRVPAEADDPQGRHVRQSPDAYLWAAGRGACSRGGRRVTGPRAKTLAETIRQRLADDILHGVYPPGARLDEKRLAERFRLSRTPVREALRQLISTGLVEMQPHRGATVSLPTEAALAEMFEVMGELEGRCARLAAQRISPAERVRLEAVHRLCAEAVHTGDRERYRTLNFDFHDVIYRAAHNDFLFATTFAVRQRIAPFR